MNLTLQNMWRYAVAFLLGVLMSYAIFSNSNLSQANDDSALAGNVSKLKNSAVCQTSSCELLKTVSTKHEMSYTTAELKSLSKFIGNNCELKVKKPSSTKSSDDLKTFNGI